MDELVLAHLTAGGDVDAVHQLVIAGVQFLNGQLLETAEDMVPDRSAT